MSKSFGSIPTNSLEILESPVALLPSMEPTFTVTISGTGTISNDATLNMKLYKGSKDVSSTMLSGSMGVNGRTITCKKISSLVPGDYVFYIYFTDDGVKTQRFCRLVVGKEGV